MATRFRVSFSDAKDPQIAFNSKKKRRGERGCVADESLPRATKTCMPPSEPPLEVQISSMRSFQSSNNRAAHWPELRRCARTRPDCKGRGRAYRSALTDTAARFEP